jgi:hypothetical protein
LGSRRGQRAAAPYRGLPGHAHDKVESPLGEFARLTAWERSKGGYVRLVRLWKRKYEEAQEELDRVRRTLATTQPAEVAKWYAPAPRVAPPSGDVQAAGASQARDGEP